MITATGKTIKNTLQLTDVRKEYCLLNLCIRMTLHDFVYACAYSRPIIIVRIRSTYTCVRSLNKGWFSFFVIHRRCLVVLLSVVNDR